MDIATAQIINEFTNSEKNEIKFDKNGKIDKENEKQRIRNIFDFVMSLDLD